MCRWAEDPSQRLPGSVGAHANVDFAPTGERGDFSDRVLLKFKQCDDESFFWSKPGQRIVHDFGCAFSGVVSSRQVRWQIAQPGQ